MSLKVSEEVRSRTVGSASAKAVLLNLANRTDDLGRGARSSRGTMEKETELGRTTVKRELNALSERGLIRAVGMHRCANGYTVEYALNLAAIRKLPEWKKDRKIGAEISTAGAMTDPVHSGPGPQRPLTGVTTDPHGGHHGPLTVLEQSMKENAHMREAASSTGFPSFEHGSEAEARACLDAIGEAAGWGRWNGGEHWPRMWRHASTPLVVRKLLADRRHHPPFVVDCARELAAKYAAEFQHGPGRLFEFCDQCRKSAPEPFS